MTRIVDNLERRGLVARHRAPDDARRLEAVLADAGRAIHAEAGRTNRAVLREALLDRLAPEEPEQLAACWRRVDRPA